jgi:hypothetical protein
VTTQNRLGDVGLEGVVEKDVVPLHSCEGNPTDIDVFERPNVIHHVVEYVVSSPGLRAKP